MLMTTIINIKVDYGGANIMSSRICLQFIKYTNIHTHEHNTVENSSPITDSIFRETNTLSRS